MKSHNCLRCGTPIMAGTMCTPCFAKVGASSVTYKSSSKSSSLTRKLLTFPDYYAIAKGEQVIAVKFNGESHYVNLKEKVEFLLSELSFPANYDGHFDDRDSKCFDMTRQWPGMGFLYIIADNSQVAKMKKFKSSSSTKVYETMMLDGEWSCNCPGWIFKKNSSGDRTCKHIQELQSSGF